MNDDNRTMHSKEDRSTPSRQSQTAGIPDRHRLILGTRVDLVTYQEVTDRVTAMALNGAKGYVCVSNVHMVMEAFDDPDFCSIVNEGTIVTPDGMPLVWALRLLGLKNAERVYGPTLTSHIIAKASLQNIPLGFYGGDPEVLRLLILNLRQQFDGIRIAYEYSPPFRNLGVVENDDIVRNINASGCKILFVGLGCPKQERWMATNAHSVNAVMLGVGAAFDFISGMKRQAPLWMQNSGLEWLFRISSEPSRLWKRYLYHNPRFLVHFFLQYTGLRSYGTASSAGG